jgi:hypothetical protein
MLRHFICSIPLLMLSGVVAANDASPKEQTAAKETPVAAVKVTSDGGAVKESKVAKAPTGSSPSDAKAISGISILGNQEAPKSLVIVPWKSSQIGDATTFARVLDDSRQPVDKEVFMRELAYYEVRSQQP